MSMVDILLNWVVVKAILERILAIQASIAPGPVTGQEEVRRNVWFLQCDIKVPEQLREQFEKFPPISKTNKRM